MRMYFFTDLDQSELEIQIGVLFQAGLPAKNERNDENVVHVFDLRKSTDEKFVSTESVVVNDRTSVVTVWNFIV